MKFEVFFVWDLDGPEDSFVVEEDSMDELRESVENFFTYRNLDRKAHYRGCQEVK